MEMAAYLLRDGPSLAEPEELLQHERLLLLAAHGPPLEGRSARILEGEASTASSAA